MLEQHLHHLVQDLELSALSPKDAQERWSLPLTPELSVSMKELDPGVFFFAMIAVCPDVNREHFFNTLMRANFLGQGTGGGVIGLDSEEKFLTLSLAIPYDLNYKAFKEGLEDFINYVGFWREEVQKHIKMASQNLY